MITEGWMNHKGGNFSADISDIEAHARGTGKDVHCPGCKKKLHMDDLTPVKNDENETTHWRHKCPDCSAKMTIFNEASAPSGKALAAKSDVEVFQKYGLKGDQISKARKLVAGGMSHEEAAKKVCESKPSFKQFLLIEAMIAEAKSTHKDGDIVKPHKYSVKLLSKGKGKWPALKGEIYEKDVMIGKFTRGAVRDNFIPPIEHKFGSAAAKARFEDFADSLSIAETIEALLP